VKVLSHTSKLMRSLGSVATASCLRATELSASLSQIQAHALRRNVFAMQETAALACIVALATLTVPYAVSAATIDAANVSYRAVGASAVERNVSGVLDDTVSVLDFGATRSCLCGQKHPPLPISATCCPVDDTAAFASALASSSSVFVPPGNYRIDGTVEIPGNAELKLDGGVTLMRTNLSVSTDPVVVLSGWFGALVGNGHVTTVNAAPNGVVAIGPVTQTRLYNTEWNRVEGVRITGPGVSWSTEHPNEPVNKAIYGSIGLCINSTAATFGGATYVRVCHSNTTLVLLKTCRCFNPFANIQGQSHRALLDIHVQPAPSSSQQVKPQLIRQYLWPCQALHSPGQR
jgi:hypothetical protein